MLTPMQQQEELKKKKRKLAEQKLQGVVDDTGGSPVFLPAVGASTTSSTPPSGRKGGAVVKCSGGKMAEGGNVEYVSNPVVQDTSKMDTSADKAYNEARAKRLAARSAPAKKKPTAPRPAPPKKAAAPKATAKATGTFRGNDTESPSDLGPKKVQYPIRVNLTPSKQPAPKAKAKAKDIPKQDFGKMTGSKKSSYFAKGGAIDGVAQRGKTRCKQR